MSPGRETGRGWRFFQTLSKPPEKMWPQGAVHHGSRILLLLLVAAAITAMFPPRVQVNVAGHPLDSVPDEAVIARIPFTVLKGVDDLRREQDEASAGVPPTFSFREEARDSMVAKLTRFFTEVDRTAQRGGAVEVGELLAQVGVQATAAQVSLLVERGVLIELRDAAIGAVREMLPRGVIDIADADVLTTTRITVRGEEGVETTREVSEILLSGEFYQQGVDRLGRVPPDQADLFRNILVRHFESSLVQEAVATRMDRNRARDSVDEIKEDSMGLFVRGRLLMELSAAKEAFILMKEGALDSMSIGFRTVVDQFDSKTKMRKLLELQLFEISLVAIPGQLGALVTSVKQASPEDITTKRDLENALCNAGFSVSTSKFITAGWTPPARRDVEGGKTELVASIRQAAKKILTV